MQFKPLLFLAAAFSFTQAQAALTAKDVIDAIHNITDISAGTWDTVRNTSSTNVVVSAAKITDDLRKIVTIIANDVQALQGAATLPKFPDHDQADICDALSGFAKIHQDLFKALASKKIDLDATTFLQPIETLLILLRAELDGLAEGVIALVPTCGAKARDELKDLDKTLSETISTFTVRAPDVPSVQPPVATNHPIPAPLPVPLPSVIGFKPTEISATGPIGTPVAAPVRGQ
ncbi:hypothetical protein TGAMA5MH_05934 [Trichoderma gamsii]|uniref:Cell wall protein n=1 Tax=Trichoderma gamsii TaxID=398673 RepID=A0A2K0T9Q6_9HYPO|nr:hypothetical protein TGAMA5MH_05934 [Trichoderma gamsii]